MKISKQIVFIIVTILLLFTSLMLFLNGKDVVLKENEILASELSNQTSYSSVSIQCNNISDSTATFSANTYAKSYLSEKGKQVYESILKNAEAHNVNQFAIPNILEDNFTKVFISFLNDNPQVFYVSSVKYFVDENDMVNDVKLIFNTSYKERVNKQALIDESVSLILEQIKDDWSDYEKVLYLYDTIIKNTTYDITAPDNQNIYSVLVNKRSVCAGYARTIQYLMTKLDMFCLYITGDAKDTPEGNIGHAWNLVKMDDEYYYLDATWGDPMFRLKQVNKDYIGYGYFGITTKELKLTHVLDTIYPLPKANCSDNNYYVKEDLIIDSKEAIESKIISELIKGNSKNQKYYSFKFSSKEIYNYAIDNIFVGEYFNNLVTEVNKNVTYKYRNLYLAIYPSEEKLIVDFTLRYVINRSFIENKTDGKSSFVSKSKSSKTE